MSKTESAVAALTPDNSVAEFVATTIGREEFADRLGVTPREFDALRAAGEVGPELSLICGRRFWDRYDAEMLLRARSGGRRSDAANSPCA